MQYSKMWKDHCNLFFFFGNRGSLPPVVGSFPPRTQESLLWWPWLEGELTLAVLALELGRGEGPGARISRVCCRSWNASAEPSASSSRSGNHSWPGWQLARTQDCHSWRILRTWNIWRIIQHHLWLKCKPSHVIGEFWSFSTQATFSHILRS